MTLTVRLLPPAAPGRLQHRADRARPPSRGRLLFCAVALVGLGAGIDLVRRAAPLQSAGARSLLGPWWSWTARAGAWQREPRAFLHGGLRVTLAAGVLTAAWAVGALLVARHRLSRRWVLPAAASWVVPFAVAPPILSRDAYAYLAQGAVGASGDPYRTPLTALGSASPLLHGVDPLYRTSAPPYGPLGLRLLSLCLTVAHGHALPALVLLRLTVLACLFVTVLCCTRLVEATRRPQLMWLIAANPVVLLHLVGGLHLDAVVTALLAAAALLASRGAGRSAAVAVVAAAAIKVTAVVALLALLARSVRRRDVAAVVGTLAASVIAVAALVVLLGPNPFGWLHALHSPLAIWDPTALPTAAAVGWAELAGGSPLAVLALTRVAAVVVGLALAAWAWRTADRRPTAVTLGLCLGAVLVTAPIVWPWYLVPVACLLATGRSIWPTVLLTMAVAFSDLPMPVQQMQRVTIAGYAAAALAAVALVRRRQVSSA